MYRLQDTSILNTSTRHQTSCQGWNHTKLKLDVSCDAQAEVKAGIDGTLGLKSCQ